LLQNRAVTQKEKIMAKTVYKDRSGTRLVGTTTVTGTELGWNKGILINWANGLGLEGIESAGYVDNLAAIGTLGHRMVLDKILGRATDTKDYSFNQIAKATSCLCSYDNWSKDHKLEPILMEQPLVSEQYKFGGTPDFYGKKNDKLTLIDYKTGKGIYDEHFVQVSGGYLILLEENGYQVDEIEILNIPRSEGESFQVVTIPDKARDICKTIFLNCLSNYKLHRLLKE
jgi:hypothetical protein